VTISVVLIAEKKAEINVQEAQKESDNAMQC